MSAIITARGARWEDTGVSILAPSRGTGPTGLIDRARPGPMVGVSGLLPKLKSPPINRSPNGPLNPRLLSPASPRPSVSAAAAGGGP